MPLPGADEGMALFPKPQLLQGYANADSQKLNAAKWIRFNPRRPVPQRRSSPSTRTKKLSEISDFRELSYSLSIVAQGVKGYVLIKVLLIRLKAKGKSQRRPSSPSIFRSYQVRQKL